MRGRPPKTTGEAALQSLAKDDPYVEAVLKELIRVKSRVLDVVHRAVNDAITQAIRDVDYDDLIAIRLSVSKICKDAARRIGKQA